MFHKALLMIPLFSILSQDAEAKRSGNGTLIHAMINNVDLTDEQKIAFFDMRQDAIEDRKQFGKKGKNKREVIAYAKGNISAKEWHEQIDQAAEEKFEKKISKMKFIHDILKTYSQEQKEQFVENLNSRHRIVQVKNHAVIE